MNGPCLSPLVKQSTRELGSLIRLNSRCTLMFLQLSSLFCYPITSLETIIVSSSNYCLVHDLVSCNFPCIYLEYEKINRDFTIAVLKKTIAVCYVVFVFSSLI
ncbi:hypothetical protein HPP92_012580 [Vanilla planifolia]|uniref:Uncharacterized protein n=1 Tax=Vanilla planifolia TaxID=51239 RepID=A0A835QQR5_VANPL|nr:hypothetical protein HPP92_012580 [Vanilla planifolia]